ncbi:HPr family phosphocarrier protein, partial [Mesorhizobium sp. M7A.F.Ca.CA.003.01.2.1]
MTALSPEKDQIVRDFPIINQRGLHARASAKFVQLASGFD